MAAAFVGLADVYRRQGKYTEAVDLLREASARFGDRDNGRTLYPLAEVYRLQGRYIDAEPLYIQSIKTLRTTLGDDHPDLAQSEQGLADLYRAQGRYAEAEQLYHHCASILQKSLGPEHPLKLYVDRSLADLYRAQRRYAEAKQLYDHSLEMLQRTLGFAHPEVSQTLNNLAELLFRTKYVCRGSVVLGEKWSGRQSLPLEQRVAIQLISMYLGLDCTLW
jgi:tetratricopeptide (TPR) repeat protein